MKKTKYVKNLYLIKTGYTPCLPRSIDIVIRNERSGSACTTFRTEERVDVIVAFRTLQRLQISCTIINGLGFLPRYDSERLTPIERGVRRSDSKRCVDNIDPYKTKTNETRFRVTYLTFCRIHIVIRFMIVIEISGSIY